ncbi:MAG: ABC transporter permease [Alphaproteobacteria bacterium]|nr:ABC transporter permease [Alphaproteobacteria bacterium]
MTETVQAPPQKERRQGTAPIVPVTSVASRTLMLLVTIMTFLSCVTVGSVVLIQKSAIGWSADVGREVTIEIRPMAGEVIESNVRTAISLAESVPGIGRARVLSQDEVEGLLAPWLGRGLDLTNLKLPQLVVVEIAEPQALDVGLLSRTIATVPGASLETHAAWRQQLNVMTGTVVVSGLLVLALILLATILAVVFATRGTMASSREIVDVLHFIGASNQFIASEFQKRFLTIGVTGGAIGGVAALMFFLAASLVVSTVLPSESSAQLGALFGRFALGLDGIAAILIIVPVVGGLTALTSRLTVRRFLEQISS